MGNADEQLFSFTIQSIERIYVGTGIYVRTQTRTYMRL